MAKPRKKFNYKLNNIKCLRCGNTIGPHSMGTYRYYRCRGFLRDKSICSSKSIRAEILEEEVDLQITFYAIKLKNTTVEDITAELKRCHKNIQDKEELFFKKFSEERADLIKKFFKNHTDKWVIADYKNLKKEKYKALSELEDLEMIMVNLFEVLQKGEPFIDVETFKIFRSNIPSLPIYFNIPDRKGKISIFNPIYLTLEEIYFNIKNKKEV